MPGMAVGAARSSGIRGAATAVVLGWLVLGWTTGSHAQAPTIDSGEARPPGAPGSMLGDAPGSGGGTLINQPGTGGILGGRPGTTNPKGIPTTIATPASGPGPTADQVSISAPAQQPVTSESAPLYGTLDIPNTDDDGPTNGLTLDQAIAITLERSLDLKAKFYEIPMARADILQASLRANPIFYQDGQLLEYPGSGTRFSRSAPGGPSQYDTNVTFPLDVSHKRQARTQVAAHAERVLEAQYQDAIRQRIDDVYTAYVTALAARQTVRFSRKSVEGLEALAIRNERLFERGEITRTDLNRVRIQLQTSRLGLVDAESAYRKAKLDLGSILNLKIEELAPLELRGSIRDTVSALPPREDLRKIALLDRPDLASFRLGLKRAEADVKLARANAYNDVYLLWQPYTFQDNSPYGLKGQYSWALGVTVPLPVFNRNQGGIQRARINVDQTAVQLQDLERQVAYDVEAAILEYEVSKREVRALEEQVIPRARESRDDAQKRYLAGATSIVDYLNAQLEFNQAIKQFLDTAIRHRRSMLALNTVVGRRIVP